jgi:hypothetical protein
VGIGRFCWSNEAACLCPKTRLVLPVKGAPRVNVALTYGAGILKFEFLRPPELT